MCKEISSPVATMREHLTRKYIYVYQKQNRAYKTSAVLRCLMLDSRVCPFPMCPLRLQPEKQQQVLCRGTRKEPIATSISTSSYRHRATASSRGNDMYKVQTAHSPSSLQRVCTNLTLVFLSCRELSILHTTTTLSPVQ